MIGWFTVAVGVLLVIAGAAVRWGRVLETMAGRRIRRVRDLTGLRRWAGSGVACLGAIAVLAGLAGAAELRLLGGGLWAVFILGVLVVAVGARRYGVGGRARG